MIFTHDGLLTVMSKKSRLYNWNTKFFLTLANIMVKSWVLVGSTQFQNTFSPTVAVSNVYLASNLLIRTHFPSMFLNVKNNDTFQECMVMTFFYFIINAVKTFSMQWLRMSQSHLIWSRFFLIIRNNQSYFFFPIRFFFLTMSKHNPLD